MFEIHDDQTFYEELARDLRVARTLVLMQSPYLSDFRLDRIENVLKACIKRRVRICVFVRTPKPGEEEYLEPLLKRVLSLGLHVTIRDGKHEKVAVVDEEILWDGSLNALSQTISSERMTRWSSREMVFDAIKRHNLNACQTCLKRRPSAGLIPSASPEIQLQFLGEAVAKRREQLEISQKELAARAGVVPSVLSRFEAGRRFPSFPAIVRICHCVYMEVRALRWCALPVFDDLEDGIDWHRQSVKNVDKL